MQQSQKMVSGCCCETENCWNCNISNSGATAYQATYVSDSRVVGPKNSNCCNIAAAATAAQQQPQYLSTAVFIYITAAVHHACDAAKSVVLVWKRMPACIIHKRSYTIRSIWREEFPVLGCFWLTPAGSIAKSLLVYTSIDGSSSTAVCPRWHENHCCG